MFRTSPTVAQTKLAQTRVLRICPTSMPNWFIDAGSPLSISNDLTFCCPVALIKEWSRLLPYPQGPITDIPSLHTKDGVVPKDQFDSMKGLSRVSSGFSAFSSNSSRERGDSSSDKFYFHY